MVLINRQIEITHQGRIQIRWQQAVESNGNVIPLDQFHRESIDPGDTEKAQKFEVLPIAQAVWTPQILTDWATAQAEN
jgi:hypothetical protein